MEIIEIFHGFAEDFERCVDDDSRSRLEKYLANDATDTRMDGDIGQAIHEPDTRLH